MPSPGQAPEETLNVTQAYQTVEARLTEAAAVPSTTPRDSATPDGLPTATPTLSPATPTITPPAPTAILFTPTSAQLCDVAAPGNPIDVTVPDDSLMQPGQAFTKIWRLQNVGTCTWNKSYAVTFFSGEQMGAPPNVALAGDVRPGQSVDIAVDMTAPQTSGKYQGNWKLRNAANVLFGIGPNGSAPFWVRIVVAQTATPTLLAATSTSTVTPTATPPSRVSGTTTLVVNNSIDLDTNQLISGTGGDVTYQSDDTGQHMLIPQGSALVGVYGSSQPGRSDCQAAALSGQSLIVEQLTVGSFLCYQTDQGLPGRARIQTFNIDTFSLTLEILTWNLP